MSASARPMPVLVLVFFGTIAAASLMYVFLLQAWMPMMEITNNAVNSSAGQQGLNTIVKPAWNNWAMWTMLGTFVFGIAGAAAAAGRL